MGPALPAQYALGLRTSGSWTRDGLTNWWETGWEIVASKPSGTETLASGTGATMRVSAPGDDGATAWYARLTRLDWGQMRLEAFLPTGQDSPNLFDFEVQMDRRVWKPSVNEHSTYRQTTLIFDHQEASLGTLDSMNIFSNLAYSVSQELRAVEWLAVKAVRLE